MAKLQPVGVAQLLLDFVFQPRVAYKNVAYTKCVYRYVTVAD